MALDRRVLLNTKVPSPRPLAYKANTSAITLTRPVRLKGVKVFYSTKHVQLFASWQLAENSAKTEKVDSFGLEVITLGKDRSTKKK